MATTDESEAMPEDHTKTFGAEATKLVTNGYGAINDAFAAEQKRGTFSSGSFLGEKLHSGSWTIPPLLTSTKLIKFQGLIGTDAVNPTLQALWYILENVCRVRLTAILLLNSDGEAEARLWS
jgi:hypothetical protein